MKLIRWDLPLSFSLLFFMVLVYIMYFSLSFQQIRSVNTLINTLINHMVELEFFFLFRQTLGILLFTHLLIFWHYILYSLSSYWRPTQAIELHSIIVVLFHIILILIRSRLIGNYIPLIYWADKSVSLYSSIIWIDRF